MADEQAVSVRVTGRVQGVGFREWTRHQATGLGLTGWVRNEPDGSVTAVLIGGKAAVDAMLERLYQGPSYARVASVTSEPAAPAERFSDFRITR